MLGLGIWGMREWNSGWKRAREANKFKRKLDWVVWIVGILSLLFSVLFPVFYKVWGMPYRIIVLALSGIFDIVFLIGMSARSTDNPHFKDPTQPDEAASQEDFTQEPPSKDEISNKGTFQDRLDIFG